MDNLNNNTNNNVDTPLITINTDSAKNINTEWIITLLLCFFLGVFGIHRFYNGKIVSGIFMILTLGGFGIWSLIDLIFIIVGRFTKKDGTLIPIKI